MIQFIRKLFTAPIRFYRKYLSGLKKESSCRFTPTCSQYAIDAIMEWGPVVGLALAFWRILRCNPFSKGGYDPVPLTKKHKNANNTKEIQP